MAKGQELVELVDGIMELSLLVADKIKKGQAIGKEVPAILEKLQKDPVYIEAVTGISEVPAEIRSYGMFDYLRLLARMFSYAPRIITIIADENKDA